jgi:hypothetical protein
MRASVGCFAWLVFGTGPLSMRHCHLWLILGSGIEAASRGPEACRDRADCVPVERDEQTCQWTL